MRASRLAYHTWEEADRQAGHKFTPDVFESEAFLVPNQRLFKEPASCAHTWESIRRREWLQVSCGGL